MKKSIVILASGAGSLAQAIIDAAASGRLDVEILEVISDQPHALVLERAARGGIKTFLHPMRTNRTEWDFDLIRHVAALQPDLVVSVGFMRILSPDFVSRFRVINSHPALLPKFPGAHPVRDTLLAGAHVTGATVHWVDSGVDTGKIIAQREVEVLPRESESSLHERIRIVERSLIVETLRALLPTLESDHA
ncbi:MAG: phosphoribosylglycinamide formyltransferase [Actinobacteria bacterium]|nr:phosphoribosylglycinamide formyltransferase [Actinomycetota bacterium]